MSRKVVRAGVNQFAKGIPARAFMAGFSSGPALHFTAPAGQDAQEPVCEVSGDLVSECDHYDDGSALVCDRCGNTMGQHDGLLCPAEQPVEYCPCCGDERAICPCRIVDVVGEPDSETGYRAGAGCIVHRTEV